LFEPKPATAGFDVAAHRALSLQVARESIVVLKNERGILPLDRKQIRSLAVIGPNANVCRHSILYASRVIPAVTVTPLEGIRKLAGNDSEVRYSQGCDIEDEGSLFPDDNVTTPDGAKGFRVEFFGNKDLTGEPAFTKIEDSIGYIWLDHPIHPDLESAESDFSVRVTAVWTPEQSGYYHLFANSGTLSISPASHAKEDEPQVKSISGRRYLNLTKAKPYAIKAEYRSRDFNDFQIRYHVYEENALQNSVEAARRSDVAVLFLGFSETLEREGLDRSPDLPENQLELLRAVLAVNRNVIVALNSGSGVSIEPWGSGVPGILAACYPGQEGGTAIAEVLFGDVNPSGKLPFTCMRKWADSPVYGHYPQGPDEMVRYTEGIYVGYRWFDRRDAAPVAFPFGHGLSYTAFGYSRLSISPKVTATGNVECALEVTNTGKRAGAEVVQLYLGDDHASVDRPVKELKGYRKVFLKPGETTTVRFSIQPDDLKFYDVMTRDWKAEPGGFTAFIGSSSRDIRLTGKFTLGPAAAASKAKG
jgi:beta-glucosidase